MNSQRKETFKRIFWDYSYTPDEIEEILNHNGMSKEKVMILRKILMSERWYNI
ncbi:MAG: hypothetical protein ACK4GN_13595 [Runella sp.]